MGDEKFYKNFFYQTIRDEGDGQISFSLSDEKTVYKFADWLSFENSFLVKRRLNTVFGGATLVVVEKGRGLGGIYYFLLPDGYKYIKRVCLLDYDKVNIKQKKFLIKS